MTGLRSENANPDASASPEHPRLFFREADLPELRRRAGTPQGQAIVQRTRELLATEVAQWDGAEMFGASMWAHGIPHCFGRIPPHHGNHHDISVIVTRDRYP